MMEVNQEELFCELNSINGATVNCLQGLGDTCS